jgi:hypothetical protein
VCDCLRPPAYTALNVENDEDGREEYDEGREDDHGDRGSLRKCGAPTGCGRYVILYVHTDERTCAAHVPPLGAGAVPRASICGPADAQKYRQNLNVAEGTRHGPYGKGPINEMQVGLRSYKMLVAFLVDTRGTEFAVDLMYPTSWVLLRRIFFRLVPPRPTPSWGFGASCWHSFIHCRIEVRIYLPHSHRNSSALA